LTRKQFTSAEGEFRFFVFTCRKAESDFRLALAETFSEDYEVRYIWLKRRPIVTGFEPGEAPREMSVAAFLKFMLGFGQDDKVNIYLNSTNTYFPGTMAFLRCFVTAGVWCLDMHDDLRYENTGIKWLREDLIARLLNACSHVTANVIGGWVQVVRDPNECAETLAAIQAGKLVKEPGYTPITWGQRVDRLLYILRALPRTKALPRAGRSIRRSR
jgi:hypothetical protein